MKNKIKINFLIAFTCFCINIPLALFPLSLNAQASSLDQSYIDSLPENIREDVLEEMESQDKDLNTNISQKRPSVTLLKSKTVQKWEKFLKQEELNKSERYGMKLFQTMQSSFMPVNEPNFSGDYVLDFGDVLDIQLVGQKVSSDSIEIKRDGSINIPEYGKILIAGLSLQQASELIKSTVSTVFIATEAFVTLSAIRDIQVLITGNSQFPGIYTLNGNSNVLHALNVSGGISENGSFRAIDIKRDGKTIKTIDLYDVIILGNTSYNTRLRSGDSIYIRPVMNLIRAGNGFNREGIFELKEEETLNDLMNFAGYLSKGVKAKKLILNTLENGVYKSSSISFDDLSRLVGKNNDVLYSEEHKIKSIKLSGKVKNPGTYEIYENETLSSLIKRSGGYAENAYTFGGMLFRESAKKIERINNERTYRDLIKFLSAATTQTASGSGESNQTSISSLPIILSELKSVVPLGRVAAEFDLLEIQQNPSADTVLNDGDEIIIPNFNQIVYVYGEVVNPGAVRYEPGLSVMSYIGKNGGLSQFSNDEQIIVIDPNGETRLLKNNSRLSFLNSSAHNGIYPGSVIYVSKEVGEINKFDRRVGVLAISANVVSSLAFAAASINSLD